MHVDIQADTGKDRDKYLLKYKTRQLPTEKYRHRQTITQTDKHTDKPSDRQAERLTYLEGA